MGCRALYAGLLGDIAARRARDDCLPRHAAERYVSAVYEERVATVEVFRGLAASRACRPHDDQVRRDAAGRTGDRAGDRHSLALLPERADQRAPLLLADGLADREGGRLVGFLRDEERQDARRHIGCPRGVVRAAQREVLLEAEGSALLHPPISSAISGCAATRRFITARSETSLTFAPSATVRCPILWPVILAAT